MPARNDFSRVRQSLLLQGKPDRVPLWELEIDREVKQAFLGREIAVPADEAGGIADEVAFWVQAGYDYVPLSVGLLHVAEVLSGEAARLSRDSYSVYSAEREVKWAAEGEGVLTSWEQFEAFPWPDPDDIDLSHLHAVARLLPENMRIIAIVGKIFTATWMLMGFEGFGYACAYQPDLVAAVFRRIGEIQYRVCQRCLETPGVAALWMSDDIAYGQGMMVSPKLLREHLFPWYARLGAELNAAGIPFIFHSDGDLWPVMDDILACGFNAIHPIEPKAMDSREVKARYGDRLCLTGNIELDRLSRGTPEEIREMVRRNVSELGNDGGYCVGSSNSVTYYVPLENYLAMIEAALEG
jgi:uroporphyrinogen decarboxylase